ncbi:MAG: AraC family transcriptional regulator [Spirochaetales bacterium]|nr:AraC family transcriptional regulator [Spirochaetales bacterium]
MLLLTNHINPGYRGLVNIGTGKYIGNSPHYHDSYEYNLIYSGYVNYYINNKRYTLHKRNSIWIPPYQKHYLIDTSDNFTMLVCFFQKSLIQSVCTEKWTKLLLDESYMHELEWRRLRKEDYWAVQSFSSSLMETEGQKDLYHAGLAWLVLLAWKYYLRGESVSGGSIHPSVAKAIKILYSELDIGTEELARRVGVSRSYLSRQFALEMGTNIVDWRNFIRIENYLKQKNEDLNILDRALDAGFGSYAQFYRVHRQVLGYPPQGLGGAGSAGSEAERKGSAGSEAPDSEAERKGSGRSESG